MRFLASLVLLACLTSAQASEITTPLFPPEATTADGITLKLNGTGMREKFVFDIYQAGLYLEQTSTEATHILATDCYRRVHMHFLYKEVSREKLIKGWNQGFKKNLSKEMMQQLAPRIAGFNKLFHTVYAGDEIILDYRPGAGTTVIIAGQEKGGIPGKDFSDALLRIWLGEKPVTTDLKEALLGVK